MNYLTFIRRTMPQHFRTQELQFLVSGNDRLIRESILQDVIRSCREREERLMIVDDTGGGCFGLSGDPALLWLPGCPTACPGNSVCISLFSLPR